MDIICRKLANEMIYAYHAGRFWRWDEGQSIWKESHLMAQKFERARAALKTLTPESFFSDGAEFALLDEYEISLDMAEALSIAKPCKNAPIDPVEEGSECTTAPTADAAATMTSPAASSSAAATPTTSASEAAANGLTPALSPQSSASAPVVPAETSFASAAVPSFDFSALGDLSQQAADADQQFDLHYGAAQDEYLISCIYLARIHALTAKAGRYGGGTWTKWYESKGLGEGSVRRMIQNGEAFNSAKLAELKQLPELTRRDLNLIARSGCADQLTEAAGDSQRVQELLAQLKAEKDRADTAEKSAQNARKENAYFKELVKSAEAQTHKDAEKREEAESRYESALADIRGLKEQNAELQQSYHDADEGRIAARLQCQKAEGERDKAEARAKNAEGQLSGSRQVAEAAKLRADKLQEENAALKKQPIAAVVDEEEVERRANQRAHDIAEDLAAEMTADLQARLEQVSSGSEQDARDAYDSIILAGRSITSIVQSAKMQFRKLPDDQRETAINQFVHTLASAQGEVSACL